MDNLKKTYQGHALSYSSWYLQHIFVIKFNQMIKVKLLFAEHLTPDQDEKSMSKLEAVESIKIMLSQIDHLSEKVPLGDSLRFIDLLSSLKGAPLNNKERQVALEISG